MKAWQDEGGPVPGGPEYVAPSPTLDGIWIGQDPWLIVDTYVT